MNVSVLSVDKGEDKHTQIPLLASSGKTGSHSLVLVCPPQARMPFLALMGRKSPFFRAGRFGGSQQSQPPRNHNEFPLKSTSINSNSEGFSLMVCFLNHLQKGSRATRIGQEMSKWFPRSFNMFPVNPTAKTCLKRQA